MATSDTLSQQLSELRLARGASHFHPFPRLPLELRRIVWGLCRPHRIVDLDYTLSPEDLLTACRGVQRTSTLNSKPPIISRVCRESREVALQGMEAPVFEDTVPSSENHVCIRHNYWFNSSTDLIHLNWKPKRSLTYSGQHDFSTKPLAKFLHKVSQGLGASLTAAFLYPFEIADYPQYIHYYCDNDSPFLEMLEARDSYTVTLKIITLHVKIDDALTSGLFGRLGEERVVLVDASNKVLIKRYYDLWNTGLKEDQDQEPREFFQEVLHHETFKTKVEHWKYELKVDWLAFKWD